MDVNTTNARANPVSEASLGPTITIGEVLVEIMATTKGEGFLESQPLMGPFPSGAPAIFIDQVGKLGQDCGIIASVGKDDFGTLNINRLKADGVDVSAISIDDEYPTAHAFVRYDESGDRDFIFNIAKSAAGRVQASASIDNLINRAGHLHIMGTALTLPSAWPIAVQALEAVKARGGSVSFDPNMRKELKQSPEVAERLAHVLEMTDLFMPSGDEVSLLGEGDAEDVIQSWIANTGGEVVLKRGGKGAICFSGQEKIERPAIPAIEVDPTGAGDCFGATYLSCRRMNYSPERALDFANAAGHLAVSTLGPMEGNSTLKHLQTILDAN